MQWNKSKSEVSDTDCIYRSHTSAQQFPTLNPHLCRHILGTGREVTKRQAQRLPVPLGAPCACWVASPPE